MYEPSQEGKERLGQPAGTRLCVAQSYQHGRTFSINKGTSTHFSELQPRDQEWCRQHRAPPYQKRAAY